MHNKDHTQLRIQTLSIIKRHQSTKRQWQRGEIKSCYINREVERASMVAAVVIITTCDIHTCSEQSHLSQYLPVHLSSAQMPPSISAAHDVSAVLADSKCVAPEFSSLLKFIFHQRITILVMKCTNE